MKKRLLKACWLLVGVAAIGLATLADGFEYEGQPVMAVRVVSEEGEVLEQNPALPLQAGRPFTAEAVRESLQVLHRTGLYAEIRAEATRLAEGVSLSFVVRPNYFVNVVHVLGLQEPPNEALALAAMRLNLGEPFRESALEEALERLRAALREEGFYQAQFEVNRLPQARTRQLDLTVVVSPGRRARLGPIALHNQTGFPDLALLWRSKLKPGQELTAAHLAGATERIREFLVEKGHLGARVNVRRGEYNAGRVPLDLEITAGPKVRVEVVGANISAGTLRRLLPIYEEGAVDEDLLQEGRRDIRDYLESRGYFDSEVTYTISAEAENGALVITYQVRRGFPRRLVGIEFTGNRYFSDELLRSQLRILPAAFLSPGRFSRRLLRADEGTLKFTYESNGFLQAQIRSEILDDYAGKEGDLFVRFHVTEGPQTRVAELHLEGNEKVSDEQLVGVGLASVPGQPYSEANVETDRDVILRHYFNEGFPEVQFEAAVQYVAPNRVRLTYRITEGRQITVKQVLIGGYEQTRRGVISREVQLQPGGPLRAVDVVDTQRRLYNLGIFSRVTIAAQNPEGTDPNKTIVVAVEEAKRYTMAYGGGVEVQRLGGAGDPVGGDFSVSPRGIFEITRANFTGRAHTIALKLRASTLQGRALLSYAAPNLLAKPSLSLLMTGFADKTRDVTTFTAQRYEASAQLTQSLSPITSLLYRYSFRRVLVDPASLRVPPEQIPLFSQPTKISALGLTWIHDTRDNPADPAKGNLYIADLGLALRAFGSSASFVRLFFQNSTFHPFGRWLVFARSLRVGIQEPLGTTTGNDIPLPERFFAGGGNSLRGFGLNQAGPRNPATGFPVGGLAMLIFNQELRFPMRLPWVGERISGAVFYDAGNVFTRANRITFRWAPPPLDPGRAPEEQPELNYLSHTIGLGFRYQTPVGPVRFDLGLQLNPARFEFCSGALPADPRCPAGQGIQVTRLPRFQFFFNFGSVF